MRIGAAASDLANFGKGLGAAAFRVRGRAPAVGEPIVGDDRIAACDGAPPSTRRGHPADAVHRDRLSCGRLHNVHHRTGAGQ